MDKNVVIKNTRKVADPVGMEGLAVMAEGEVGAKKGKKKVGEGDMGAAFRRNLSGALSRTPF